jgi:hypothetical protein
VLAFSPLTALFRIYFFLPKEISMTLDAQPPEHWARFSSLVRGQAPRFPMERMSQVAQDRAAAGRAFGAVSAMLDGIGGAVPGPVGLGVGVAGTAVSAGGAEDVANGALDMAASTAAGAFLPEAGFLVGGLIMLMRGAHQSLARSDAMVTYLLGVGGFVNTLGRLTVSSMRADQHYTTAPQPQVANYIAAQGDLFSSWRRQALLNGYRRAMTVVRSMDEVSPTEGDSYSKRCLIHVGIATGFTGRYSEDNWRLRQRAETIYIRHFLAVDLTRQRDQLRRWANAP